MPLLLFPVRKQELQKPLGVLTRCCCRNGSFLGGTCPPGRDGSGVLHPVLLYSTPTEKVMLVTARHMALTAGQRTPTRCCGLSSSRGAITVTELRAGLSDSGPGLALEPVPAQRAGQCQAPRERGGYSKRRADCSCGFSLRGTGWRPSPGQGSATEAGQRGRRAKNRVPSPSPSPAAHRTWILLQERGGGECRGTK